MRPLLLALLALGGCSFDPTAPGSVGDASPPADAEVAVVCAPGTTVCSGRNLETCNQAGDGFVDDARVVCPLTCVEDDHCTAASNLPIEEQLGCDASAPALRPDQGATLTVNDSGGVRIDCSSCGGGPLSIPAAGTVEQGDTDLAWFCLSSMEVPAGVALEVSPTVVDALGFLVDGETSIAGDIDASGGAATAIAPGAGGPGGGLGGPLAIANGIPGSGPCFGGGGSRAGTTADHASGGGAGGGHRGAGGDGGDGRNPSDNATGGGGLGGASGCGVDALVPLVGGGGGGSGSDGSCSGVCGWPGGGGGGAIQIASRARLAVSGFIAASGGDGFGSLAATNGRGGAGGGGAGGAILLESAVLAITGQLGVDGGNGGKSGAGAGAAGASAAAVNGADAADGDAAGEGGAGGGGGGGRIRLNTLVTVMCSEVATPHDGCTVGDLLAPASAR